MCRSQAYYAALLLSGSCAPTAQVAVVVPALPMSGSLSSTELAPPSIPNARATPQSGAPNSSQCAKYTTAAVIGLA